MPGTIDCEIMFQLSVLRNEVQRELGQDDAVALELGWKSFSNTQELRVLIS